jgi:predicted small lipoprotein YifL
VRLLAKIGFYSMLMVLISGILAGCGRKGAPVAPHAVPLSEEEKKAGVVREKKKPGKRFILDGLLE